MAQLPRSLPPLQCKRKFPLRFEPISIKNFLIPLKLDFSAPYDCFIMAITIDLLKRMLKYCSPKISLNRKPNQTKPVLSCFVWMV